MNPQAFNAPPTQVPDSAFAARPPAASEPATCNFQPETPPAAANAAPEAETCNLAPATCDADAAPRRLKGKIASLPKAQRDTINALLLDGATYARVIQRMAQEGVTLNGTNLTNWYQTGYQDYLAELERLDYQRAKYESATTLLQNIDTAKLPEAGLQSAAAQIYDLLGRFTPATLARNMAGDPDKYTRLLNSLFRLCRETVALQKNREPHHHRGSRSTPAQTRDVTRKLSDSERRAIVREVDDILGVNHAPIEDSEPTQEPISAGEHPSTTACPASPI